MSKHITKFIKERRKPSFLKLFSKSYSNVKLIFPLAKRLIVKLNKYFEFLHYLWKTSNLLNLISIEILSTLTATLTIISIKLMLVVFIYRFYVVILLKEIQNLTSILKPKNKLFISNLLASYYQIL